MGQLTELHLGTIDRVLGDSHRPDSIANVAEVLKAAALDIMTLQGQVVTLSRKIAELEKQVKEGARLAE